MQEFRTISEKLTLGILDLELFANEHGLTSKREQEKRGAQYLLQAMLGPSASLIYDGNGKPHLADGSVHLSISHSHGKLAILINKQESTGVDIELIREKVLSLRHKYLNDDEQQLLGMDLEKHITWWAAKEALYKLYGQKGLDFRKNLEVWNAGERLYGRVSIGAMNDVYRLQAESIGKHILVYVEGRA